MGKYLQGLENDFCLKGYIDPSYAVFFPKGTEMNYRSFFLILYPASF